MGTYGSAGTATFTKGKLFQPESRVRWNGTLESSSWVSLAYNAPAGFSTGTGIDFGLLGSLAFSSVPAFSPAENINFKEEVLYEVTGEETTLTVGIKEWSPEIIAAALGTGTIRYFVGGAEAQITFGGLCDVVERPLVVEWTNVACSAPTASDVRNGISGGVLTLYRTIIDSGLPVGAISAKENTMVELRFRVLADTTRARGNRLGNLYLY